MSETRILQRLLGKVFGPRDLFQGRKKRIENALSDLNPSLRDSVFEILETWGENISEDKLTELVGKETARRITEQLRI